MIDYNESLTDKFIRRRGPILIILDISTLVCVLGASIIDNSVHSWIMSSVVFILLIRCNLSGYMYSKYEEKMHELKKNLSQEIFNEA